MTRAGAVARRCASASRPVGHRGLRAPRPRSPDAPLPQGMPKHLRESDVAFACASYFCPWCRHPRNFDNRADDESDDTSEDDAPPPPRQSAVRRPPDVDSTANASSDAESDGLGANGRLWKAFAMALEAQIAGLRTELSTLRKRKTESKKKRDERQRLAAASSKRAAQQELPEEVRGRFRRPGPVAESGRSRLSMRVQVLVLTANEQKLLEQIRCFRAATKSEASACSRSKCVCKQAAPKDLVSRVLSCLDAGRMGAHTAVGEYVYWMSRNLMVASRKSWRWRFDSADYNSRLDLLWLAAFLTHSPGKCMQAFGRGVPVVSKRRLMSHMEKRHPIDGRLYGYMEDGVRSFLEAALRAEALRTPGGRGHVYDAGRGGRGGLRQPQARIRVVAR